MTRIGILSDIHGNVTALKAVLADCKQAGVVEYWLLGDTFLPGPGGDELVDLLESVNLTVRIMGNWEENFLEILSEAESSQMDLTNPVLVQLYRQAQYLHERLSPSSLEWLRQLKPSVRLDRKGL